MAVINTNTKALFTQSSMKTSDRSMSIAMQQLSTGKRINSARDDAAGLSIATRMTEQIRSLNQAVRNSNDAINLIQTAEGATNEITDMMQRMRELAVQAVNDTNSNEDRSYLDLEFQQLKQQIVQISDNTQWNGFTVLNGKAGQQVGEMPVYKVTSDNNFGSVFIQPTTSKTLSGQDAGEVQQFNLGGTPSVGTFSVAGVSVAITSSENSLSAAADKIVTTLNNASSFANQGITVSHVIPQVVSTTGEAGTSDGVTTVTLKDMKAGQVVTVDGQTFKASKDLTASQVANVLVNGLTNASPEGTLTGNPVNTPTLNGSVLTYDNGAVNAPTINVNGSITINYSAANGNVDAAALMTGSTGLTIDSQAVASASAGTTREAVTSAVETFASGGGFLQSGGLQISVPKGAAAGDAVTATFTNADNQKIQLTGTLNSSNPASVIFKSTDGINAKVISSDLTYTFQTSTGSNIDLSTTANQRALTMTVGVQGSIPTLRSGDLMINGVNVGQSLAADDLVSPRNNAAGSAISLAAAINRVAVDQGISQGKTQAITFSGTPLPGTVSVGGISVTLTTDDNTPALAAAKIAAALKASPAYNTDSTQRNVVYANGSATISIGYPASEGDVAKIAVESGSTGLGSVVNTTQEYATKMAGTGVFAKVNENVYSGQAMVAGKVETGVVFVNGYASANIETVYNNPQATRANTVRAINMISDKTGVKAIDTGSDDKGIQLVAADGRNIEIQFEPTGSSTNATFGQRIGIKEGVQRSTISLESKIDAPIVLGSDAAGDISRTGLVAGDYAKNESILNTKPRDPVDASVAQVNSVKLSGTADTSDQVAVVVNGTTFTADNGDGKPQTVAQSLIDKINSNSTLGVYATLGSTTGELLLTARTPGVSFTMTAAASSGAHTTVTSSLLTANHTADVKSIGMNDLVINGVSISPATQADDQYSYAGVSSSDPASSAIAMAAAINRSSELTGVKAYPNAAEIDGSNTSTGTPVSGKQSLWVNGIEIQVDFTQNEPAVDRRNKVVDAMNQRTGQTGVVASDNGAGVTLKTSDGRNLSVWFDSSKDDLKASDFGLDEGGSVSQQSKVTFNNVTTGTASIMINGVTVSATAGVAPATANNLKDSINQNTSLKNVVATVDTNGNLLITSTVPGTGFDLRSPSVSDSASQSMTLSTVTANSQGNNHVSAVDMSDDYKKNVLGSLNAPVSAMNIKTVYGTVKMVSNAPVLPTEPDVNGITPSSLNATGSPIQISAGTDGFGSMSNFSALGFNEGSFGGRASEDMNPPRVGRLSFQVGAESNQVITIDLADFGKNGSITGAITGDVDLAADKRSVRINTKDGATAVLNLLDDSMNKINATRATMGAVMNRLDHVVNNLTNVSTNMSASRSTIEDADYALASTDLAKAQIMQQAATAVLAQANTSQQSVLKLLGG